jgi:uncharacterized membrane protein
MDLRSIIEVVGLAIDVVGVGVITLAVVVSGVAFGLRLSRGEDFQSAYQFLRRAIGRGVLLGLELLVAGDIIRTVAIEPTLTNVAVLGLIVLVRTFLSFSLEVELTGAWPWSRRDRAPMSPEG